MSVLKKASVMAVLALAALAGTAPSAPAATDKNVFVIGKSQEPDSIDPQVGLSSSLMTFNLVAYERLVGFKVVDGKMTGELEPSVASSWSVSSDGKVWTMKIAPGHQFADGKPVDAAAVKFSFDRLLKLAKGPNEDFPALTSTDVVDASTVRFTLSYPFAAFLPSLASEAASLVDPQVMQHEVKGDMGAGYLADHTMGSGPYELTSWEKGQQAVLEPNPHYAGPKPNFDKVVIKIIKEFSVRRLQLEKGDLDLIEEIPPDQVAALRSAPNVTLVEQPSLQVCYLYLNNRRAPLNDVKVRQALSYAVDYKGVIDAAASGSALQMRGIMPKGMPAYDPTVLQYNYDPEKAKALLKEAKVGSLKLGYLYSKSNPLWEPIGLVLQQNLAALGIDLKLQELAYPTMRAQLDKGDFDIAAGVWTPDFADPSQFLNYWLDPKLFGLPGNRSFYDNPKVAQLLSAAVGNTNAKERLDQYLEAQKIAVEDAAYILLFQRNYIFAMRSDVGGFVFNPLTLQGFNFDTMTKGK